MAGTPTTNYNIPTYADTDAPDLSGAYNDAMGIIDTQLKANADAIESASTGNYTGTSPIVVDNEQRTISVSKARSAQISDGAVTNYGDKGTLSFAGSADVVATVASMPGDDKDTVVPNCYALTQYVAKHGGTAYTAGSGISISGTTIAAKPATTADPGVVTVLNKEDPTTDVDNKEYVEGSVFTPTVYVLKKYVEAKMAAAGATYTGTAPIVVDNGSHTISVNDATTSAKGAVQLTASPASADSTMAVTGSGVVRLLSDRKTNATTNVTVEMLKNLYVDPSTGVVYYKAPSE